MLCHGSAVSHIQSERSIPLWWIIPYVWGESNGCWAAWWHAAWSEEHYISFHSAASLLCQANALVMRCLCCFLSPSVLSKTPFNPMASSASQYFRIKDHWKNTQQPLLKILLSKNALKASSQIQYKHMLALGRTPDGWKRKLCGPSSQGLMSY